MRGMTVYLYMAPSGTISQSGCSSTVKLFSLDFYCVHGSSKAIFYNIDIDTNLKYTNVTYGHKSQVVVLQWMVEEEMILNELVTSRQFSHLAYFTKWRWRPNQILKYALVMTETQCIINFCYRFRMKLPLKYSIYWQPLKVNMEDKFRTISALVSLFMTILKKYSSSRLI